eukprot:scaffold73139_cov27-Phaeocystis_antarctica.AAC.3
MLLLLLPPRRGGCTASIGAEGRRSRAGAALPPPRTRRPRGEVGAAAAAMGACWETVALVSTARTSLSLEAGA